MLSITIAQGLSTTTTNNTVLTSNAKTLLVAVDKINSTCVFSLNRVNILDYEKKNQVVQQYNIANALFTDAKRLVNLGYHDAAISKLFEAMKLFKDVLEVTTGMSEKDSVTFIQMVEEIRALKDFINRTYVYVRDIERFAAQAKAQGYDTTEIVKVITEVRLYLKNGLTKLSEANIIETKQYVEKVKALSDKLTTLQNALSNQMKMARLEKYVILAKARVVVIRNNITAISAKLPAPVVTSSLTTLNQAQASLTAADSYYNSGMIKETVDELVNFHQKEVETIGILKAANVTIRSVDSVKVP